MSDEEHEWVMEDRDGVRYIYRHRFPPPGNQALGLLAPRTCHQCHRQMIADGSFYRCADHGINGKIRTVEEERQSLETCDPRWRKQA